MAEHLLERSQVVPSPLEDTYDFFAPYRLWVHEHLLEPADEDVVEDEAERPERDAIANPVADEGPGGGRPNLRLPGEANGGALDAGVSAPYPASVRSATKGGALTIQLDRLFTRRALRS